MYDCLELPATPSQANLEVTSRVSVADPLRRWRNHPRLVLRLSPHTAPHRLQLAYAAAVSLGLPTQNLPDGRLLVLDLTLEEALVFNSRFADLLGHYEPARHQPR
ncbi:hypothetical protein [Chitinibacter sp. ZOR0017]|uniref:hypothetical protein n=1 Tax=Chitinibacter sp. ZOR0017 TaxID=1339254 RepID=UPI0006467076|nr:hypothetical protein [Chitinibacter sp. ZOR0017]